MRIIRTLLRWILIFITMLILGIVAGYGIATFTSESNSANHSEIASSENSTTEEEPIVFEPNLLDQFIPAPESVDKTLIENVIFESVNGLRNDLGLPSVSRNETLTDAANIRAIEIEESFSHTRPNGTEPFTVLEEAETTYHYLMAGENLAMATYYRDDEYMARLIFNGWVESEDHYETMINPDFNEIGIGVHYNGEILYATQFFGLQR